MEFKEFAKKLKNVIGGASNTKEFTKTLFETMMNDSGPDLLASIKPDTFKAYFNGNTSISKVASLVLANLSDDYEFSSYLDGFGETAAQLLADEFKDDIPGISAANASGKITELFLDILRGASSNKKSTPKSAKNTDSETPHDILTKKIFASGQAMADAWGADISNLTASNTSSDAIVIPEEQPSDIFPYAPEDKQLLQEFTADYDEILFTLIGENYADSLVDMVLPSKIQDLYNTKWNEKANTFLDSTLKSYVFGLLGVLNQLSNSLLLGGSEPFFIKQSRTKIRNLYVKLHPDSFSATFPNDAFIDDWDDGEF